MHDKYDVEMDGGDDEPTLIINPKCKERLGISNDGEGLQMHNCCAYCMLIQLTNHEILWTFLLYSCYNPAVEVIRVHRSITRKGKTWRRGDHLKILPGATGRMKNTFYSLKTSLCTTLEYIVVEGLQGDICGEFTHVLLYSSFMTYPHSERGWHIFHFWCWTALFIGEARLICRSFFNPHLSIKIAFLFFQKCETS